ncbi:peptide MFS transporter [Pontibacter liquoris]|uniref:peptide MFS transporter n=1 Tax=Pontibacter liquoris TaxID=2905677 RepID=UPI001FA6D305|nr:peptide MFS transporter [Pontibacter liquoris]
MSGNQNSLTEEVNDSYIQDDAVAKGKQKHPKGLYLLFFTELWERFSYYGMRGLLTLYLSKTVIEGGLGFSEANATLIYGWFTGLVYLTPIAGGWLADKYLGHRRAILIGGVTMALGQFSLFSTPYIGVEMTYLGLALLILGNGFFKPNISSIVGNLYAQGDPRRDSAFTIFYMGINVGAFFAPLICGYLAEDLFATKAIVNGVERVTHYGFQFGFLAAGIGMVIGQIVFNTLGQKYLGDIGLKPVKVENDALTGKPTKTKLTKEEVDRVSVIFIITVFVIFFWAGFEQAGSSLTLYTDKYIDREVFGFLIPTSWFQSVNPLFIVAFAPLTANLWIYLSKRGKDLSIPTKMGVGMILLGIGFFFMVGAVMQRGGVEDEAVKASIMWLIATYFFHTIGELCLSPIGLSMVTRLAPVTLVSMLMGVWFLAPFVAQIAGGYIASYVEELGAFTIFSTIGVFVIVAGLILVALTRKLMYMMHGRG